MSQESQIIISAKKILRETSQGRNLIETIFKHAETADKLIKLRQDVEIIDLVAKIILYLIRFPQGFAQSPEFSGSIKECVSRTDEGLEIKVYLTYPGAFNIIQKPFSEEIIPGAVKMLQELGWDCEMFVEKENTPKKQYGILFFRRKKGGEV